MSAFVIILVVAAATVSADTTKPTGSYFQETTKKNFSPLPSDCGRFVNNKFYSGNRTDFDDYPWLVLLEYDTPRGKSVSCGGVLISSRHVLTAAHCVANLRGNWSLSSVRVGEYNTNTTVDCLDDGDGTELCIPQAVSVKVERAMVHEKYGWGYDLAIINLAEDAPELTTPVCLPSKLPLPQRFHVAGWGRLARRSGSNLKLRSYLTSVNSTVCKNRYNYMAEDQICAGVGQEHLCVADSGGPLMGLEKSDDGVYRMTVFGLLTMNSSFCDNSTGLFTQVLPHRDWILKHVSS